MSLDAGTSAGRTATCVAATSRRWRTREFKLFERLTDGTRDARAPEQSFNDVDNLLMNYFTYRALKETLAQMQETDLSPGKGEYKWLYNFAASEYKNRGDEFIKKLFAEGRSDHAQRILAQRVVLLKRWRSYFNRGLGGERCQEKYEDVNLEILREQLFCSLNAEIDECVECDEATLYNKILKDSEQE